MAISTSIDATDTRSFVLGSPMPLPVNLNAPVVQNIIGSVAHGENQFLSAQYGPQKIPTGPGLPSVSGISSNDNITSSFDVPAGTEMSMGSNPGAPIPQPVIGTPVTTLDSGTINPQYTTFQSMLQLGIIPPGPRSQNLIAYVTDSSGNPTGATVNANPAGSGSIIAGPMASSIQLSGQNPPGRLLANNCGFTNINSIYGRPNSYAQTWATIRY